MPEDKGIPLVEVKWLDAFFRPGWISSEELLELVDAPASEFYVKTVGYLLDVDDDRVVLSMSVSDKEDDSERVGEIYWVPVSCVIEMTELERVITKGDVNG